MARQSLQIRRGKLFSAIAFDQHLGIESAHGGYADIVEGKQFYRCPAGV